MTKFPKKIAYFARAETAYFHLAVCKKIKAEWGSEITLFCNGKDQLKFYNPYLNQGLFSKVVNAGLLLQLARLQVVDEEGVFEEARKFEAWLGSPYARLSVANRHLGRGFAPGGGGHPRSHISQNASLASLSNAYTKTLQFLVEQFEENRVDLLVNPTKEACVVGAKLGIARRLMAGSRFANYHYWAWNEHYESPIIADKYNNETGRKSAPGFDLLEPYDAHRVNRSLFLEKSGPLTALWKSVGTFCRFVYWKLRGYEKGSKGYLMWDMVKLPLREYSQRKELKKIARTSLEDIQGKDFIFFPLHIEPEAALQIISPEFLSQRSAILSLARELPAGKLLAVKEAFGMVGRRPMGFYKELLEHKNVVLLRVEELGLDCIKHSKGVATISGTAGLEACVIGRPVITFGRHNMYNVVEDVTVVVDDTDLWPVFQRIFDHQVDHDAIRQRGLKLLNAIIDSSWDMGSFDYRNQKVFGENQVDACLRSLEASLRCKLPEPVSY